MPSYPGAVKAFTSRNSGDVIQPAHVNDLQDEVAAIETGLLNGTAQLNSSNSTLANLSVTGKSTLASLQVSGNSTLGSSITIGAQPYIFPSSGGSTGNVLMCVSTSGSTMGLEWRAPSGVGGMVLLRANSGSDSNAAAANMDTVAISGLTANDAIFVRYSIGTVTQTLNLAPLLYQTTDPSTLAFLANSGATAAKYFVGTAVISQAQAASTTYLTMVTGNITPGGIGGADSTAAIGSSIATAWTGSWTLALRHQGVTAGGSLKWSWGVYRMVGQ